MPDSAAIGACAFHHATTIVQLPPARMRAQERLYVAQQEEWGLPPGGAAEGAGALPLGGAAKAPMGRGRAMVRPAWMVRRTVSK